MDPEEIAEDLLQKVAKMRAQSKPLKLKYTKERYEELILTLQSAEFFLYRMEIREANVELNKAISLVEKE